MVDDEPESEQAENGEAGDGEAGGGEAGETVEQTGSGESREEGTGFVADGDGNVEVVQPEAAWGGPGQEFGGIRMGGPFQGRDRFVLTPASFWSRPLRLLLLLGGVFYFINVLPAVVSSGLTLWRLLGLVGIPLVAAGAVLYRWWKLPEEPIAIEFHDDHVDVPKGADNPSRVQIDYRDIRSLVVMVRGETEILLFETEHHRFTYSDADIREPNGARLLKDEIMRRIRSHPESGEILDRMRGLEERARAAAEAPTPVTYALIGSVIVGYVLQYMTNAWSSEFGLLQIGANSAPLIADGQWWRLISGNFLHGNFLHIFLNGLALLFLGVSIERLIGSWRFLLIYLVTAVGGAVGSFWVTQAPISLGASTALYGLVGAFGVLHVKYWNEIPPPYRQTIRWWVVILALNFGLSALPVVDAAAHFFGMGVGIVLTFALLLPVPTLDPRGDASVVVKVLAAAMTAVFAAGLAMASTYAQVEHPGDGQRVVGWMIDNAREEGEPRQLNRAAWRAATWTESTTDLLENARRAARLAVEQAGERGLPEDAILQFRDTEATVLFRLARQGDEKPSEKQLREVVEIEREIVERASELVEERSLFDVPSFSALWGGKLSETDVGQFRAQLVRFLAAYAEAYGPYTVGESLPEGTGLELASRGERLAVVSKLETRLATTTELIAVVTTDGGRIGAFRVCLPKDSKSGVVERFAPGRWSSGVDGEASLRIVSTKTRAEDCPDSDQSVEFWPSVPSIRELP